MDALNVRLFYVTTFFGNKMKKILLSAVLASVCFSANASGMFKDTYMELGYVYATPASKLKHGEPGSTNTSENNLTSVKRKFDHSSGAKLAFGKQYGDFRGELEYMFIGKQDMKKNTYSSNANNYRSDMNVKSHALMLNGYYDVTKLHSHVTPYVGFGIGAARNEISEERRLIASTGALENKVAGTNKNKFAYNVMLGAKVKATDSLFLNVGYKYIDLGKLEGSKKVTLLNGNTVTGTVDNLSGHNRQHMFMVGVGAKF